MELQVRSKAFGGSERESVKPCVWRGLLKQSNWTAVEAVAVGNVEARVLCGSPSSESRVETGLETEIEPALGASFPQRTVDFRGFGDTFPFS